MMSINECLRSWDAESTLKWVLARGVSLKKWKAFALHAGVVDGRVWSLEKIAREGRLGVAGTRARICQVVSEVESALTQSVAFSPHDPKCRRAVYNFLNHIRPPRAESRYRMRELDGRRQEVVFVYGEKTWHWCGESTYASRVYFRQPVSMNLSWLGRRRDTGKDQEEIPVNKDPLSWWISCPTYAVMWGKSGDVVDPFYQNHVATSRKSVLKSVLIFICDGKFFEYDHIEDRTAGPVRVILRPLECSIIGR